MGVLNLTPDSFSDGDRFATLEQAVDCALRMEDVGADFIDIGGFSSRPGAADVSEDEELRRVLPVISALAARLSCPISVDTFRARVFAECFESGAAMLNDISAFRGDEAMLETLAKTQAPACLMHMQGDPQSMQERPHYEDVVAEVTAFFQERLASAAAAGVSADRLLLDPGIGFGKTLEHNLLLLRAVPDFAALGCGLLYGTSRKSFLGKILGRPDPREREWATAATTAYLFAAGVHVLRVHDVAANIDVLNVVKMIHGKDLG